MFALRRYGSMTTGLMVCYLAVVPPAAAQCGEFKLYDSEGAATDRFSFTVAAAPGLAVVGVPFDDDIDFGSGSVQFFRPSVGGWTRELKFLRPNGQAGDAFGWSVGVSGDSVAVGLVGYPIVEVYARDGSALELITQLVGPSGSKFGDVLSLADDRLLVGARYEAAAYVFERDLKGVWFQAARVEDWDGLGYYFGGSVAIDGDLAVVGAKDDWTLANYSGSAYIFERNAAGEWLPAQKLLPHDGGPLWQFGQSVAISGDTILVGADAAAAFNPSGGTAYIFERDPNGTWSETTQLINHDNANSDFFGVSVALDGSLALVGAENNIGYGADGGAGFVFQRQLNGEWIEIAKLVASDSAYQDEFGRSVALSGNLAVIGAPYDDNPAEDSGSAYVFAVSEDRDLNGAMDICECPADLSGDKRIDLTDLSLLLVSFGVTGDVAWLDGDLNLDATVDLLDLSEMLIAFGGECP